MILILSVLTLASTTLSADPLQEALDRLLLTPSDLRLKTESLSDPFQLPQVLNALHDPAHAPQKIATITQELSETTSAKNILEVLAALRLDAGAHQPPINGGNTLTEKNPDLPQEIAGLALSVGTIAKNHRQLWDGVGRPLRDQWRIHAISRMQNQEPPPEILTPDKPYWWQHVFDRIQATERFPLAQQEQIAEELAQTIEKFILQISQKTDLWKISKQQWKTEEGAIVIGSLGHDIFSSDALMIIDPGGDDIYQVEKSTDPEKTLTRVIIDLGGNDVYQGPGALECAIFGIHYVLDFSGDDIYQTNGLGQGCGIFGIGVLEDISGNDIYSASVAGQGTALWGTGLLLDRDGDDVYRAGYLSQGAGSPAGTGALIDLAGNDSYEARGYELDPRGWIEQYGDFKQGRVYQSLSQGFGYGWRDLTGGGIGILMDASGNDDYSGDYLAQGAGYWLGLGVLADNEGNDRYAARRYAQGSGVHYAAGALLDASGNDTYVSWAVSQGSGHDYALGLLWDQAGNDAYATDPGAFLQIGASNASGVGILFDGAGSDQYLANMNNGLGWGSWDEKRQSYGIGLVLDSLSRDDYLVQALSTHPWTRSAGERGYGLWSHDPLPWKLNQNLSSSAQKIPPHQAISTQRIEERFYRAPTLNPRSMLSEYLAVASSLGEQTGVISQAKELLFFHAQQEKTPLFLEFLNPHNVYSVLHLEEIFSLLGDAASSGLINKLQTSTDETERARSCYFLTQSRSTQAVNALLNALGDSSWKVRWQASRALSRLTDQNYLEKLEKLLNVFKTKDQQALETWIRAEPKTELLILLHEAGISPEQAISFAAGLAQESPPGQQPQAGAAILINNAPMVAFWLENKINALKKLTVISARLIPMTYDPDRDVRRWAVVGLGWAKNENLCPMAGQLFEDPDYTVRDAAIKAISNLGKPCNKDINKLKKSSKERTRRIVQKIKLRQ